MLHQMFYFGVILPTVVVVLFFIVFLICWYKCNMRQRFTKSRFQRSPNSTQSSIVSASSGPYPRAPPSRDYWDVERCPAHSDKESVKYIPGEFSVKSDDWIYMSQDSVRRCKDIQVWATKNSASSNSSFDSDSADSQPCLEGCCSPHDVTIAFSSSSSPPGREARRSSPAVPLATVHNSDRTTHLSSEHRAVDTSTKSRPGDVPVTRPAAHWSELIHLRSNSDDTTSSDIAQIRWLDTNPQSCCSPYAITNLINTPAISV